MVPVIGLVQVGQQSLADRYTWILPESPSSDRRGLGSWSLACLAVVLLAGVTVWQTGFWQSSERLFERSLQVTVNNHLAHFLYAESLRQRGDELGAIEHHRKCAAMNVSTIDGSTSWYRIGRYHEKKGEVGMAIISYQRSIA